MSLTSQSFSSSRGGPDSASRRPQSPHWGQAALGMRWGARRPPLVGWLTCFVLRWHSSWPVLPVPTSRVGISPGDLHVPCTWDSVTASLSITRGEGDSLKMSLPASPRVSPPGLWSRIHVPCFDSRPLQRSCGCGGRSGCRAPGLGLELRLAGDAHCARGAPGPALCPQPCVARADPGSPPDHLSQGLRLVHSR